MGTKADANKFKDDPEHQVVHNRVSALVGPSSCPICKEKKNPDQVLVPEDELQEGRVIENEAE